MTTPFTPATQAMSGSALAKSTATANVKDPKAKAWAAAQNFEAMFLNSMLQHTFTGIDGEGPFGGSGASGIWRSFLTQEYAKSMAKAGGIGLASHVYQSLMAHQQVTSSQ